ncbi:MAG TPA: glycosyltransferase [Gemmatimonadaceae bacterium]|nr:glycosyltransferase [Gemmatimonadaceae bacterium]
MVLVIPCYNEALRFRASSFREFLAQTPDVVLAFVDDGSTDGTHECIVPLAEDYPLRVTVVRLPRNGGKAEAVRKGIRHALGLSPAFVGYWDADLATPLSAACTMRELLRQNPAALLVMGARVQMLGRDIRRRPVRHYAGRVFATVAALMLGVPVYDTQCGAKLLRVTGTTRRLFDQAFASPWAFDVELLARLMRSCANGALPVSGTVVEYPLPVWHDVPGSKVRPHHLLRVVGDLMRIGVQHRWRARSSAGGDTGVPPIEVQSDGPVRAGGELRDTASLPTTRVL